MEEEWQYFVQMPISLSLTRILSNNSQLGTQSPILNSYSFIDPKTSELNTDVGADANPYLVMASVLAGIHQRSSQ